MRELVLAGFFMAFGLATSGALTHLAQSVTGKPLGFGFESNDPFLRIGKVLVAALCGPYLLLQAGWAAERDGTLTIGPALMTALVAFGWAFITGLMLLALAINLGL